MAHDEIIDHYSALARAADAGRAAADCEQGGFGAAGYDELGVLPEGAVRASLGCGNPVAVAELQRGETVLDLGSGGGIDVLLSARRVGPHGKVYGLDASPDMLALARRNAEQAGARNVEFLHGVIEHVPLPDHAVDAVISNCVINLSGDKASVLSEAFRVLRPGGRFGVSDVVVEDDVDQARRLAAEQRIGCVAGALPVGEYRASLAAAGLVGVRITLTADHGDGVHSAIVQAAKPAAGPGLEIRPMRETDAEQVLAIYQAGLDTGQASFETAVPSRKASPPPGWSTCAMWPSIPRRGNWSAGWRPPGFRPGPSIAGVIEHSIYVHPGCQSHGIGRALLGAFVAAAEDAGVWTIQSGVFPENAASLALHQALGFRKVGVRERVGRHHGVWRDVVLIERRSPTL